MLPVFCMPIGFCLCWVFSFGKILMIFLHQTYKHLYAPCFQRILLTCIFTSINCSYCVTFLLTSSIIFKEYLLVKYKKRSWILLIFSFKLTNIFQWIFNSCLPLTLLFRVQIPRHTLFFMPFILVPRSGPSNSHVILSCG